AYPPAYPHAYPPDAGIRWLNRTPHWYCMPCADTGCGGVLSGARQSQCLLFLVADMLRCTRWSAVGQDATWSIFREQAAWRSANAGHLSLGQLKVMSASRMAARRFSAGMSRVVRTARTR